MAVRRCAGCMQITEDARCPICGYPVNGENYPHQLPVGTVLRGRYQLGRVLGQGGYGITYLAWDHTSGERVAVKEFYPNTLSVRDSRADCRVLCMTDGHTAIFRSSLERFLREASALQRFRGYSAIVDIRDFFEDNNTAYIVMEYLSGSSLEQYVQRRGRLEMGELLPLLEPVIQALGTVHREGMVHRDISPDNIMLDSRAGAKLLDFGAVRSVQSPDVNGALSHSTEAILKHGFAPIEQYNSRGALGPWTDEYALCASIYYCLTGHAPENAPSRITEGEALDWTGAQGLSSRQRAVLEKGMALRAKDRYPDIPTLWAELQGMTRSQQKRGHLPVWAWAAIAGCAAAAVLIGALAGAPGRQEEASGPAISESGSVYSPPVTTDTTPPTPETTAPESIPPDTLPPEAPPAESQDRSRWESNILTKDPLGSMSCQRESVVSVTFRDTLENVPENAYYLAPGGSPAVQGWVTWDNGGAYVTFAAEGGINAADCCEALFMGCENLETIDFGGAFHTDDATVMLDMFNGCTSLRDLDLRDFNTGKVTTFSRMFLNCGAMIQLDVSMFDTSSAEMMYQMFAICTGLRELSLGDLDTSRVKNMGGMFSACRALTTLDVSGLDTGSVTNMEGMFGYCSELEDLDLSTWDVSSVVHYNNFLPDGKTVNGSPWREFFEK